METIDGWFTYWFTELPIWKSYRGVCVDWKLEKWRKHTHTHQCGTMMFLTGLPRLLGNSAMASGFLWTMRLVVNIYIYIYIHNNYLFIFAFVYLVCMYIRAKMNIPMIYHNPSYVFRCHAILIYPQSPSTSICPPKCAAVQSTSSTKRLDEIGRTALIRACQS